MAIFAVLWYFSLMRSFIKGRLVFVRMTLLVAVLALFAVGIATIYAVEHPAQASAGLQNKDLGNYWQKQLIFAAIGAIAFIAVNMVNYRWFGSMSFWFYGIILVLLALLLVSRYIAPIPFMPINKGTHRWIQFKIGARELPAIQPSEICKLVYIVALAWYLRYRSNYRNFRTLMGPFLLTVLPTMLILLEPDLGTVMLMMPIFFTMLFVAGAKVKHLLLIVLMAILISPLMWLKMEPYQRIRISSVLLQNGWLRQEAESHPKLGQILVGSRFNAKQWENNWGYHLVRSKFAIASGGAGGYGFRKGPFIKYNFLPTRHNDFIFSVIAHQWGFAGCLGLFMLYALVIACGLEIAANNTDPFGRLIAVGIVAMFAVEVIVNVSMTVGLMPITGLTLPFVSYGGSSLIISMTAVGLLNNVGRCRPFGISRDADKRSLFDLRLRQ